MRETPGPWLVLDELRRHPVHWHTLTAAGGFAAVKCFDCGFTAEGGYSDVVSAWNSHLPVSPEATDG